MKRRITEVRFSINEGIVSMVDPDIIYSTICVKYKVNRNLEGEYIGIFKDKLTAKDVVEAVNSFLGNLGNIEKRRCLNGKKQDNKT